MNFPYTESDFEAKNEEVWTFINDMSLESVFFLVSRFDSKKIRMDLMEVFREKAKFASIPESVYVLDLIGKKFSLENYFMEEILLNKINGGIL